MLEGGLEEFEKLVWYGARNINLNFGVREGSHLRNMLLREFMSLTARTVKRFLFDRLWQSVLKRLAPVDVEWAAYVETHALFRTDDNLRSESGTACQIDKVDAS